MAALTSNAPLTIVVVVLRRALERFQALLEIEIAGARLTGTFGVYFGGFMGFVIIASLGVGGLGVILWLASVDWGPELVMFAMGAVGLCSVFGIAMIGVLSVADVGISSARIARDSVRALQTVRRQRARPEAGQLTIPEGDAEGGLSPADAEAGAMSVAKRSSFGAPEP